MKIRIVNITHLCFTRHIKELREVKEIAMRSVHVEKPQFDLVLFCFGMLLGLSGMENVCRKYGASQLPPHYD